MANNCQFHQNGNFIHVLISGQDLKEEDVAVQIQRRRLTVVIKGMTFVEGLLQGSVDVGNCRVKIQSDYVEVKLRKLDGEEVWPQLMLGIPDMMTRLQRELSQPEPPAAVVSPEGSPSRSKPVARKSVETLMNASFNASVSNFFHHVVAAAKDEIPA
jgi:CS domain